MTTKRFCSACSAPIVSARVDGCWVFCDRQQTIDGDVSLSELNGALIGERTKLGFGLYREHVCGFNSRKSDIALVDENLREQQVVNALDKADRLARAKHQLKPGTIGFALQVLAREVRETRASTTPAVDDVTDEIASVQRR